MISRGDRIAIGALVVVALASTAWVFLGYPGLATSHGWFYRPAERELGSLAVLGSVAALAALLLTVGRRLGRRGATAPALALLCAGGFVVHLGAYTAVDDRGWDGVWQRVGEGHGEFARVAAARRGAVLETLLDYEALAGAGRLEGYARSKPPGSLAVYMVVDALARHPVIWRVLTPLRMSAQQHPRTSDIAGAAALIALLFTLGSALTIVPLLYLARGLFGADQIGYDAGLLYVTCPAFMVIGFHLDNALFPAVVVTACALAARGARRDDLAASAGAGVVSGLAIYLSFGLLAAAGLALGCVMVVAAERAATLGWRDGVRPLARHGGAVIGVTALTVAVLAIGLDFAPLEGSERAIAFHARWKAWVPTARWRWMSVVELAFHFGVPAVLAFVVELALALAWRRARAPMGPLLFALGLVASLTVFAIVSGTNEMARLWMFLLPLFAFAIAALHRVRPSRVAAASRPAPMALAPAAWPLWALAIGQGVLGVATKLAMPW